MKKFFKATLIENGFEWQNEDQFSKYSLKHAGAEVLVFLTEKYGIRTLQQNRYYFGVVVKTIAEETGHSKDKIHEELKKNFLDSDKYDHMGEWEAIAEILDRRKEDIRDSGERYKELREKGCPELTAFKIALQEFSESRENDLIRIQSDLPTTTTLSKEEFGDYIDDIKKWSAMKFNIFIPDPEDTPFNYKEE